MDPEASVERFPYAPFKESTALRPNPNAADFNFSSIDADAKAWTVKANGLAPGFSFAPVDRKTVASVPTEGADRLYDIDKGPKAGLATRVASSSFSRAATTFGRQDRWRASAARPATAGVGPGSYFADPRLTASPIRSRAMTTALLRATHDPRAGKPGLTATTTGKAIARPALMAREGVTQEELRSVVMHYSRRQKHLQQRRIHRKPKHKAEAHSDVVPAPAKAARQWTHRLAAVDGVSIAPKGFKFPSGSRFKAGASVPVQTPGPGAYHRPEPFVKPPAWRAQPHDAFPSRGKAPA